MVENLSDKDFSAKTKKGNAIIDFYADWCGPCQMMKPIFEKASKDFKKVNFYKVDVDANSDSPERYGVRSIPTLIFLKDGEEVDRVTGVLHEEGFKEKVKKLF